MRGGKQRLKKNNASARRYLYQLRDIERDINIKYQELDMLKAQVGIRAIPGPDQAAGRSGNRSDSVSGIAVKIVSMEKEINKKIDKLIDLKQMVTGKISMIGNRDYEDLLTCRYVLNQNWKTVAENMGYSEDHCRGYLHKEAVKAFEMQFNKKIKVNTN